MEAADSYYYLQRPAVVMSSKLLCLHRTVMFSAVSVHVVRKNIRHVLKVQLGARFLLTCVPVQWHLLC